MYWLIEPNQAAFWIMYIFSNRFHICRHKKRRHLHNTPWLWQCITFLNSSQIKYSASWTCKTKVTIVDFKGLNPSPQHSKRKKKVSNSQTQLFLADWPFTHNNRVALKARKRNSKQAFLLCKTILSNHVQSAGKYFSKPPLVVHL